MGKYNEFHELRSAGVRWADSTGFRYSREDVDARSLANVYAQYLGTSFTDGGKPLEVEVLVAQLAIRNKPTKIYHIAFEGTITDEARFAVLGGDSETIRTRFVSEGDDITTLAITLQRAVRALSGPERSILPADLEVARLEDLGTRRTFNRLSDDLVGQLLAQAQPKVYGTALLCTGESMVLKLSTELRTVSTANVALVPMMFPAFSFAKLWHGVDRATSS